MCVAVCVCEFVQGNVVYLLLGFVSCQQHLKRPNKKRRQQGVKLPDSGRKVASLSLSLSLSFSLPSSLSLPLYHARCWSHHFVNKVTFCLFNISLISRAKNCPTASDAFPPSIPHSPSPSHFPSPFTLRLSPSTQDSLNLGALPGK